MSIVLLDERNFRIGENIRKYRLLKGLTQDELAEGICSVSQLSKVENGKTYLKRSLLKQMADRLGVAIDRIETADAVLDELSEDLQLAKDAFTIQNYEKSLEVLEQVIEKAKEFDYKEILAEGILLEARILVNQHCFDQAVNNLKAAIEQNIPQSPLQKALFLYNLGCSYMEIGNVLLAYDSFYRADEEFEPIDAHDEMKFRICFSLARCHSIMNNERTALRFIEKAEHYSTKLSMHLWRIRSSYMKATLLRQLGEVDKAEKIFLASLREAEDNDFLLDVAIIHNNMGCLFQSIAEYGQSSAHFQRAMQVLELLKDEGRLCITFLHVAELEFEGGNIEKAKSIIDRVFEITNRIKASTYLEKAKAFRVLSWIKEKEGSFEEYISNLTEALKIYDKHEVVFEAYVVSKEMAEALYQKNDSRAIEMYRKAVEYNERSLTLGLRR